MENPFQGHPQVAESSLSVVSGLSQPVLCRQIDIDRCVQLATNVLAEVQVGEVELDLDLVHTATKLVETAELVIAPVC